MIRHSKYFFISILIHITLLFLVLYTWKNYPRTIIEKCETRLCIELQNIHTEKKVKKKIQKEKKVINKKEKKVKKIVKKEPEKIKKKVTRIVEKKVIEVQKEEIVVKEVAVIVSEEKVIDIIKPKKKIFVKKIDKAPIKKEQVIFIKSAKDEYIEVNIQKIRTLISENLYYPRRARKKYITGDVVVKFLLDTDASVSHVEVEKSKSDILSRAAIQTIQDLSGKFPKPKQKITLHLPISYSLR